MLPRKQDVRHDTTSVHVQGRRHHQEAIASLIRPILEYGNAAWVPSLKREQQQIENVQRRATKMVPELRNLQYTDRLRVMKLPSM